VGIVDPVALDVYFHVGDIAGKGHCNTGWVIFEDYVLVIDANYPSGAREIISKIRALTDKPIRFAFDTHHHGDHVYGNQVMIDNGAAAVAHTGVIEELKRYETGYYGGAPGRWEGEAKRRPDVRESRLKPPSVLFPKELIFDDGKHRVELIYLGVAHTHGDAFAWLPKERVLFSGDACVNGAYNFVGDGDVKKWVDTLEEAGRLGAEIVCPGHGSRGSGEMVENQQRFFRTLWDRVESTMAKAPPEEARGLVQKVRAELESDPRIARYVGSGFPAQAEKVYLEITGRKFVALPGASLQARALHVRAHGLALPLQPGV
jgi:glyoxylase-like metal-dependent hydrolase (beta-lactamase superfamily II)